MSSSHSHVGHSHASKGEGHEKALLIALCLTTVFLIAEIIGGVITGSLALLSDAAHMFTDTAALAIALVAIRIGKRPADQLRTFGYYRYEILAAAVNAVLLFGVAIYIMYEAYKRLQNPPEIQSTGMLIVALLGLIVNLISMRVLTGGKEKSLNMKGAYLEVWSDMLGSIGVIVGAVLIAWTNLTWIDSLVAVAIGLWVLPRTWLLLKSTTNVLLEGVPEGLALDAIQHELLTIPGVNSIHDLHVWSISSGKTSLTVHVVSSIEAVNYPQVLQTIRKMLNDKFEIAHSTVQLEPVVCEQGTDTHTVSRYTRDAG